MMHQHLRHLGQIEPVACVMSTTKRTAPSHHRHRRRSSLENNRRSSLDSLDSESNHFGIDEDTVLRGFGTVVDELGAYANLSSQDDAPKDNMMREPVQHATPLCTPCSTVPPRQTITSLSQVPGVSAPSRDPRAFPRLPFMDAAAAGDNEPFARRSISLGHSHHSLTHSEASYGHYGAPTSNQRHVSISTLGSDDATSHTLASHDDEYDDEAHDDGPKVWELCAHAPHPASITPVLQRVALRAKLFQQQNRHRKGTGDSLPSTPRTDPVMAALEKHRARVDGLARFRPSPSVERMARRRSSMVTPPPDEPEEDCARPAKKPRFDNLDLDGSEHGLPQVAHSPKPRSPAGTSRQPTMQDLDRFLTSLERSQKSQGHDVHSRALVRSRRETNRTRAALLRWVCGAAADLASPKTKAAGTPRPVGPSQHPGANLRTIRRRSPTFAYPDDDVSCPPNDKAAPSGYPKFAYSQPTSHKLGIEQRQTDRRMDEDIKAELKRLAFDQMVDMERARMARARAA